MTRIARIPFGKSTGPVRVEWTDAVSHAYESIKATLERRGRRIEDCDAAIAAHALAVGAALVTSNIDHMSRLPGLR